MLYIITIKPRVDPPFFGGMHQTNRTAMHGGNGAVMHGGIAKGRRFHPTSMTKIGSCDQKILWGWAPLFLVVSTKRKRFRNARWNRQERAVPPYVNDKIVSCDQKIL